MSEWYFDKKQILNSPSFLTHKVEPEVEARYRREGARFINDVGQKLGLRFDTCATGVIYFHRFYMFHSFKDFNRYVIGTACLFLAGKVEETPKKCRDLIKAAQSVITEQQFLAFGDDPKEEVMTMERILLQTIKFDLQTEHPYTFLLKYAKTLKGDKAKIQKVVQMAWTFINDSLCTTLCLQWEPEIIAIALMHLACRLTKFEIQDWQGKQATHKGKWWDQFVEDISVKLLEDICHQVLDLYSQSQAGQGKDTSPPSSIKQELPSSKRPSSDGNVNVPASPSAKQPKADTNVSSFENAIPTTGVPSAPVMSSLATAVPALAQQPLAVTASFVNPYIAQHMYTASFMSSEGSQSIATMVGGGSHHGTYAPPPPSGGPYVTVAYPGAAPYPQQQSSYYQSAAPGVYSTATGSAAGYPPYPTMPHPYQGMPPPFAFGGEYQPPPPPPPPLPPHHQQHGGKSGKPVAASSQSRPSSLVRLL